jgi:hypothetical protein
MQNQSDENVAIALITEVKDLIRFRLRHRDNAAKMMAADVVSEALKVWFSQLNHGPEEQLQPKNLILRAEAEFKLLGKLENKLDAELETWLHKDVLDLLYTFSRQGHSGGTAEEMITLFNRLVRFGILSPINDNPEDWEDKSKQTGRPLWQNRRLTSCFSEDGGKTFFDVNIPPKAPSLMQQAWAKITGQPNKPNFQLFYSQNV